MNTLNNMSETAWPIINYSKNGYENKLLSQM